jgi:GT2 family glycosyltransferase
MTAVSPTISCVIVAYHRPEALAALLEMLDHPEIERIVVNIEDDTSVRERCRGVLVVPIVDNPGYGAGVNAGARAASGDVIVFMNDDLEVHASTVITLVRSIVDGGGDVAVPALRDTSGRVEPSVLPLATPGTILLQWALLPDRPVPGVRRVLRADRWRLPEVTEHVPGAVAAIVATRRRTLLNHPLPERYFLYWEELEWFWNLHRAGLRVVYEPRCSAVHAGGRPVVRPDKCALLSRNAVKYVRVTQGRAKAILAWPVVVLWNARLVIIAVAGRILSRSVSAGVVKARVAGLAAAVTAWREIT